MTPSQSIEPVPDPADPPRTRGIVLDKAAKVYDLLEPAVTLWRHGKLARQAVDALNLQPDDKVLDVGCATGSVALEAARRLDGDQGGLAIGLDAAPRMIRVARKKVHDLPCRFDIGVAERLPDRDGVFDKVVSTFFFHHLNLADKLTALRDVCRVLTPGGRFVITDVDVPTTVFGRFCARAGEWLFRQPEIGENIDDKLPPLFIEVGFADIERVAHDMGYVTTFVMRKPPAPERP